MTTVTLPRSTVEQWEAALLAAIHGTDTYKLSHKGDQASKALASMREALRVCSTGAQAASRDEGPDDRGSWMLAGDYSGGGF